MRKSLVVCLLAWASMWVTGANANASAAAASACQLKAPGSQPTLTLPGDLLPHLHRLSDGRNALVATRSGWVLRVDLLQARVTARLRVGEVTRATALSAQSTDWPSVLAVVNDLPNTLVLLDEWLKPLQTLRLTDKTGRVTSAVLGIQTAPARHSFVLALKDVPELWEISYNPHAPEIGLGLVHDFQYREGQFVPGYLNPQRTVLDSVMLDFALVGEGHEVLTRHATPSPQATASTTVVQVTHLDLRRQVPAMAVPPWPLASEPEVLPWVCTP